MRGRLLKWNVGCLALVALMGGPSPAQAFYWAGWPGAGEPAPPSITSRQVTEKITPPREPFEPEPPKGVPEPATLVIAGLGLGVLGLRRALKRKK